MTKCIYIMALAAVLALGCVWQAVRLRSAGYRIQELSQQIAEEQHSRELYRAHLSKLKSPGRITTLVAWLGLDLQEPAPNPATQQAGSVLVRGDQPGLPIDDHMSVAAAQNY